MSGSDMGIAARLYRGELGVNVVGRRTLWFSIAGTIVLIAVLSFVFRGFTLGIDFKGGNEYQVPKSVGSISTVQDAFTNAGAKVASTQIINNNTYSININTVTVDQDIKIKNAAAKTLHIAPESISDNQVSKSWGGQVTQQALISLFFFIGAVVVYLIIRFEWRMAIAAVASLILDLLLTAGVYSLVGFEVSPSTVIGFLTILGFALYDVVVVFDKVQENTRGITGSATTTYSEAANLAVNQTLMRSINTGLVALLPVGGLLFIGAGLLKAGTLKDLGLVLFFGMGAAVYSSIFFATPVLVLLKSREPRYLAHAQRVQAKRVAVAARAAEAKAAPVAAREVRTEQESALAGATPRPGARAGQGRPGAAKRGGRSSGGRPGGPKRR